MQVRSFTIRNIVQLRGSCEFIYTHLTIMLHLYKWSKRWK